MNRGIKNIPNKLWQYYVELFNISALVVVIVRISITLFTQPLSTGRVLYLILLLLVYLPPCLLVLFVPSRTSFIYSFIVYIFILIIATGLAYANYVSYSTIQKILYVFVPLLIISLYLLKLKQKLNEQGGLAKEVRN